jgi:hypothetical protein
MWIGARHLRYEHEENTMSKSMAELDGRRAGGLEVALLWDRTDGGLTVRVADMRRSSCRFPLVRRASLSTTPTLTPRPGASGSRAVAFAGTAVPWACAFVVMIQKIIAWC